METKMRYILPFLLLATPALAGGDYIQPVTDPLTQAECSACHMAFPPRLLPSESWRKIVGNLSNHYGEDASLPAADAKAIADYLAGATKSAKTVKGMDPANPPMRITELRWFTHEHNGEVSAARKKKAGSMANCTACHRGADKGYFED